MHLYELAEKIPDKFKYDLQEKENYPWERGVPSWALDINETRFKEITKQIEELGFNEDAGILQYVDYCYSTTQLMHIFYTNFSVIEDARVAVDKLLMKTLLNRRTEFIENNKGLMNIINEIKHASIEDGGSGAFYIYLKKKLTK